MCRMQISLMFQEELHIIYHSAFNWWNPNPWSGKADPCNSSKIMHTDFSIISTVVTYQTYVHLQ